MQKLKTVSARLSPDVVKKLDALMEVYGCNQTDAIKQAILLAETEKKPDKEPEVYHAEVSNLIKDDGSREGRAKCPVGPYKNEWVTMNTCRKCQETQCDLRR